MAYCTILSTNYLAKALTLADTLQRHHPGSRLTVLVIDSADAAHLAGIEQLGVEIVGTDVLGLPHRDVLRLATIYDLVEVATAVKPLLLRALLVDAEQAAYLDPDTYVTSPMAEHSPDLRRPTAGSCSRRTSSTRCRRARSSPRAICSPSASTTSASARWTGARCPSSTGGGGTSRTSACGTRCPGCCSTRSGATSGR